MRTASGINGHHVLTIYALSGQQYITHVNILYITSCNLSRYGELTTPQETRE